MSHLKFLFFPFLLKAGHCPGVCNYAGRMGEKSHFIVSLCVSLMTPEAEHLPAHLALGLDFPGVM